MLQRDVLMRTIERAGQALARALGLQARGEDDEALEALEQAYAALLRVDRGLFEKLDTRTLASMLGPPEMVRLVARVCHAEAQSLERLGRAPEARRRRQRAVELYVAVGPGDAPEDLRALAELQAWLRASREQRQPS